MPPFNLYSAWHNLKPLHPFPRSPVPIECESEVVGPCVSLVTAVSPESPVCLTPVSPQKQLLRTNGERRGPWFCSGCCHCLALHLWSSFFFSHWGVAAILEVLRCTLGEPWSVNAAESHAGICIEKKKTTLRGPTLESREWSGGLADAQAREKWVIQTYQKTADKLTHSQWQTEPQACRVQQFSVCLSVCLCLCFCLSLILIPFTLLSSALD